MRFSRRNVAVAYPPCFFWCSGSREERGMFEAAFGVS